MERGRALFCFRSFVLSCTLFSLLSCGAITNNATSKKNPPNYLEQNSDRGVNGIELWRSPTIDSGNSNLSARDDLDKVVPRQNVKLSGVKNPNAPLSSNFVESRVSNNDASAPTLNAWVGKFISWKRNEFQVFMTYHYSQKTFEYFSQLFSSDNIVNAKGGRENGSTFKIFPLPVAAANSCNDSSNPCNVSDTGYNPEYYPDTNGAYYRNSIQFYKQPSTSALPLFSLADEADVITHEASHAAQHALNRTALQNTEVTNGDMDAIIEGLADLTAAAYHLDTKIFTYTVSNLAKLSYVADDRNGKGASRSLKNTLRFPEAYTAQAHMDGRLISSALNDFREYLSEGYVYPVNCSQSSCMLQSKQKRLTKTKAFDFVMLLGYGAFKKLSLSSTTHDFATKVLTTFDAINAKVDTSTPLCENNNTCKSELRGALETILKARGLYSNYALQSGSPATNYLAAASRNMGFREVHISSKGLRSNNDQIADPCENLMIYPNVSNISATKQVASSLIDGIAFAGPASGNTFPFEAGDGNAYPDPLGTLTPIPGSGLNVNVVSSSKLIPWLEPGDNSDNLIRNSSSRIYQKNAGATYAIEPSERYLPSELGWIVRVPRAQAGKTLQVKFVVETRLANSMSLSYPRVVLTQELRISNKIDPNLCR